MKIGILTFHRAHNYGAVLQCYALCEILREMKHEVILVDYRPSFIEHNYKIFSLRKLVRLFPNFKNIIKYLLDLPNRIVRKKNFSSFSKDHFTTTTRCEIAENIPSHLDLYIIGSDQLWSTNYLNGIEPVFWGNFPISNNSKRVTYAISSNIKSLKDISTGLLLKQLKNFDRISVREEIIKNTIEKRTGAKLRVDIDPVLLSDSSLWDAIINDKWKKKNYIVVYQIHAANGDKSVLIKKARELAKKHSLDVVDLTAKLKTPSEFVSIIRFSKLVLTTSFHGTIFSVLFNRSFYTFKVNEVVDARSNNILRELGLQNRVIDVKTDISLAKCEIDYTYANKQVMKLRKSSYTYLNTL